MAFFSYDAAPAQRLVKDRLLPEPKLMKTSLRICLAGLALRISRACLFVLAANPSLSMASGFEEGLNEYWVSKSEPWYKGKCPESNWSLIISPDLGDHGDPCMKSRSFGCLISKASMIVRREHTQHVHS